MSIFFNWILLSGHSWYDLLKDFLVPIVGSALGVLGAFFILKHQLKKQREADDEKSDIQSASIRILYRSNVESLIFELDKIYESIEGEYHRVIEERCDFMPFIRGCRPQSLSLLLSLNYESHFKAYLESGQNEVAYFNLSYKSLIRLKDLIDYINIGLEQYNKEFSKVLQENHQLINSFLGKKAAIYIDIKKFIRSQYNELGNERETVTFQQSIFNAALKIKYLHNPRIDSDISEPYIDECNSSLHKIMLLSVESDRLEKTFGDFINEYHKLKKNLEVITRTVSVE